MLENLAKIAAINPPAAGRATDEVLSLALGGAETLPQVCRAVYRSLVGTRIAGGSGTKNVANYRSHQGKDHWRGFIENFLTRAFGIDEYRIAENMNSAKSATKTAPANRTLRVSSSTDAGITQMTIYSRNPSLKSPARRFLPASRKSFDQR